MRKPINFKLRLPDFNLAKRFNLSPKSVTYLLIGMFFLIGGFYFVLVNVVSNKGTELRMIELNNRDLEAQNQRLEVEAARLKSLKVIDENATGEVQVGDPAANNTTTGNQTTNTTDKPKTVTFVPLKMVQSQHYTYLPSYATLAQR